MKPLISTVFLLLHVVLGEIELSQPIPLVDLLNRINGNGFLRGTWQKTISEQQDFLTHPSGTADGVFLLNYTNGLWLQMQLMDTKYREGRQVNLLLSLKNYNDTTYSWNANSSALQFTTQENFNQKSILQCDANQMIQLYFDQAEQNEYITLRGHIAAPQCNLDISFSLTYQNENFLGLSLYIAFVAIISAITLYSTLFVINRIINDVTYREKLSSIPLALLTYYQWYFFALNLFSNYPYINSRIYMIIPSFCFLVCYFYTVKLFVLVWRFNNFDELFDLQQRKKALLYLLFKYYLAFICFCALVFMFDANIWFLIGSGFFMIPQIIHTALKGRNPIIVPQYIFGILAINMLYPLYLRGFPDNFKGYQPSIPFVCILIPIYIIQIGVLLSQQQFGPRWFVPGWLLPLPFNYFKFESIQNEQSECYICLSDLYQDPITDETMKSILLARIMQTPCKHQFHESCLKAWLEVKLECPACRKTLPVLE